MLIDLTSETWNSVVLLSKGFVVVEFWHEGCQWCKRLDPVLHELAQELGGRVRFAKFNVLANNEHWRVAGEYGVKGSPTLMFFCNGNPVGELVGYRPKETLRTKIEESSARCFL